MIRTCLAAGFMALAALASPAAFAQQEPSGPAVETAPADAATAEAMADAEAAAAAEAFLNSLTRRTGEISVAGGQVRLMVPDGFYYLDPADAHRVLVDAWGNPPAPLGQGMLFPAEYSPLDEASWGVVIDFEETGYVSDEDAAKIDYADLMKQMQEGQKQDNADRIKNDYPPIEVIGWATSPRYDAATHKLFWAKELQFGDDPDHTLNYDMRVLGRKGVLSLQFVAALDQLRVVETASPAVLAIPEFNAGFRYEEFNPAIDKKAEFGIAGLIAGGAGLLLAKKMGLLGVALLFLKKGWVLVVAAFAGGGAVIRRFFGNKTGA